MLDLSHPIPQRLYHIADIIEFISSINSSIMMKTIEVCKSFTILMHPQFLASTNSYMMKKKKGTKRYKESLFRSGSLKELREVIALIFADNPV